MTLVDASAAFCWSDCCASHQARVSIFVPCWSRSRSSSARHSLATWERLDIPRLALFQYSRTALIWAAISASVAGSVIA